jgi:hypothetical protein
MTFTAVHYSGISMVTKVNKNEGTFFTTLEFVSPDNLQEQISHQWNLYNIIFL